jgi:ParB-like chromosome segregation protein Spo0J
MAVQFTVEHQRTSEYRLFPENLTIRPELNGRHDLPDISGLIQDILVHGQSTPVVIRNDGGKPVLVAGFSRYRAISEINTKKLAPVKMQIRCCYTQLSEAAGFIANIAENRFRSTTTELDDAANIYRLTTRYAMTEEQVAELYFPTAQTATKEKRDAISWVKKRLKLYDLVPEAQEAVKEGRLKGGAALAIAKLSEAQQRAAMKHDGPITAKDVPNSKLKKPSKLFSLKTDLFNRIDDEDYNGKAEYITVPLEQLKALMEAIR